MRDILIVGLAYLSFLFVISGASLAAPGSDVGIRRSFAPSGSVQAVQYTLPENSPEAGGSSTRHSLENGSDRGVARCNQGKIYPTDKEMCLNQI